MAKELPRMYQNKFNKQFTNVQKTYSTLDRNDTYEEPKKTKREFNKNDLYTVEQKIYNIFKSPTYIYKADVVIVTDNEILEKRIVGKSRDNLITINNEYIPINIIRDIYTK